MCVLYKNFTERAQCFIETLEMYPALVKKKGNCCKSMSTGSFLELADVCVVSFSMEIYLNCTFCKGSQISKVVRLISRTLVLFIT